MQPEGIVAVPGGGLELESAGHQPLDARTLIAAAIVVSLAVGRMLGAMPGSGGTAVRMTIVSMMVSNQMVDIRFCDRHGVAEAKRQQRNGENHQQDEKFSRVQVHLVRIDELISVVSTDRSDAVPV